MISEEYVRNYRKEDVYFGRLQWRDVPVSFYWFCYRARATTLFQEDTQCGTES